MTELLCITVCVGWLADKAYVDEQKVFNSWPCKQARCEWAVEDGEKIQTYLHKAFLKRPDVCLNVQT